ncbi:MAG TPA: tetratricopeptide repeat protein, partial [Pseudonocardiaceae bacterium]|nr:tetratricopeptide repeat protein [Pseudonocardiaceae bacterium]
HPDGPATARSSSSRSVGESGRLAGLAPAPVTRPRRHQPAPHSRRVKEKLAWLLHRAARYLHTRGEAAVAQPLLECAFELRRSTLGDNHPDTRESSGSLCPTLWELGQYTQARRLAEDALARYRRVLGEDHLHTLRAAACLAVTLRELGQHERARQLTEEP